MTISPGGASFQYSAFVSYSHENERWATITVHYYGGLQPADWGYTGESITVIPPDLNVARSAF